jgi:hypothetical protein
MVDVGDAWKRVSKIVLLLSSTNEGEIAAAAYALQRVLEGAGLTWFDLEARILHGGKLQHDTIITPHQPNTRSYTFGDEDEYDPPETDQYYGAAASSSSSPQPPQEDPNGWLLVMEDMIDLCLLNVRSMSQKEIEFIENMVKYFKQRRMPTEKQWQWLVDLSERARRKVYA